MSETEAPPVPSNLRPYLKEIAERLSSGHAAVMVGAGFSRNAKNLRDRRLSVYVVSLAILA